MLGRQILVENIALALLGETYVSSGRIDEGVEIGDRTVSVAWDDAMPPRTAMPSDSVCPPSTFTGCPAFNAVDMLGTWLVCTPTMRSEGFFAFHWAEGSNAAAVVFNQNGAPSMVEARWSPEDGARTALVVLRGPRRPFLHPGAAR